MTLIGVDGQCVEEAKRLAATRAERDAVVDLLRDAVGRGILTLDEFEERLDRAYRVQSLVELEDLVRWLPRPAVQLHPARFKPRLRMAAAGVAAIVMYAVVAITVHGISVPQPPAHVQAQAKEQAPVLSPTIPVLVRIPATCKGVVGYESTQNAWLNQGYQFALPAPDRVSACVAAAGLKERPPVGGHEHYVHVELLLMGGTVTLPAGIGAGKHGETAPMYTVSDDSIVHIRSDAPSGLTLGQLFQEWGHPISRYGVGSMRTLPDFPITWYINGAATDDPAGAVLRNHDEVWAFEDKKGALVSPTASFDWPAGF